jgi:ATP-dependent protease HslVU (ClpYQ) peptidase subunit
VERGFAPRYVAKPEKILEVDDSYVGLVGWYAHQSVLQSVFEHGLELPGIESERDLFEFSRVLHCKLKEEYFLNTRVDSDDPYESSQMMLFILNRNGMFGLDTLRSAERYRRFAAAGSGSSYALGRCTWPTSRGSPLRPSPASASRQAPSSTRHRSDRSRSGASSPLVCPIYP